MPALILVSVMFSVIFIPCIFLILSTNNRYSYDTFNLVFPILFIVFLVCMIGVLFGATASQAKKFQTFQFVLDKDTNKMTLYTPNPYLNYKYQRSYLARLGQYLTSAWDLDRMLFRLIMPGERAGPGMGILRGILKNSWLIMYGDQAWLLPNILLASENAEIAQSLMNTIDDFLRGGTGFSDQQSDGLLSERPYFP